MEMSSRAAGHHVAVQMAALAVVLLCACAGNAAAAVRKPSPPPPPPSPPKEICSRSLVVTEIFNAIDLITPAGINFTIMDLRPIIGYQVAYVDDMFLGGRVTNASVAIGKVTSLCYFLSPIKNYCTSTLTFGSFGDITFLGPFMDSTGTTFLNAIAGGTGIFNGAQGTVKIDVLSGGESWLYTVGLLKAPKCT